MRRLLIATAAVFAIAFAGCGDEGSDAGSEISGPSQVVPADYPIYTEVTVNPEGQQQDDLEALVGKLGELPLIGQVADPEDVITDQLDQAAASTGLDFSFTEDIQPWLGQKLGIGFTDVAGDGDPSFVAALETTDEDAAKAALDKILASDAVDNPEESYEGVDYFTTPEGDYDVGVFDGYVVLTTADQFETAVDVSHGDADSLASSEAIASSYGSLDENRLATVFVDLSQVDQFGETPEDSEEIAQFKEALPGFFDGGYAFGLGATADQVYLEQSSPLIDGQPEVGESPLLAEAPGDSLAAFALADLGEFAPFLQDTFEALNDAGVPLEDYPEGGLSGALEEQTGVTIDELSAALGDGSFWVRGDLPDGVEVGGKIEATDTETATALIEGLQEQAESERGAKVGPPVGGEDVGFSVLGGDSYGVDVDSGSSIDEATCAAIEDDFDCDVSSEEKDLPFTNIALTDDAITFGFFKDQAAAEASDPESAGAFGDSDAYSNASALLGDGYDFTGAVDLGPILDEFVDSPSVPDAILGGGSPEDLIAGFIADKLSAVATGIRYEDGYSIQRYSLGISD